MRILYLDLSMGAAGDMICSALLGLIDDPDAGCDELNALGIPGVRYVLQRGKKRGISGLHMRVEVDGIVEGEGSDGDHYHHQHHQGHHAHSAHGGHRDHRHHHSEIADIEAVIDSLALDRAVAADAKAIFRSIAEAEAEVHGEAMDHIHFHEVGTMDAVADVVAASYLIRSLNPDVIMATDICTGFGSVECAHGILPVPAPATALLLKGLPVYSGTVEGELCTPTGAAIVRHFVQEFRPMPPMRIESIGYGIGTKDLPKANCLRAMLGDSKPSTGAGVHANADEGTLVPQSKCDDEVVELSCNIDDMTGEALGFAIEQLMDAGALDAYLIPIIMKKSRPATMLCAIVAPSDEPAIVQRIFELTTTLGIRRNVCERYELSRSISQHDTRYGVFRVKISSGYGVEKRKIEYDDLAAFAASEGISLEAARELIEKELS